MADDRSYVDANARQRERLRALVERLSDDVGDWLNDSTRPLIQAIAPREAAQLALRIAEQTDALVAKLPLDRLWPRDPSSPIYAGRGEHRGEHLDEIETALAGRRPI